MEGDFKGLSMTLSKTPRFDHSKYAQLLKLNPSEAKVYIESFQPKKEEIKMPATPIIENPVQKFSDEQVRKVLIDKYETKFGKKPFG